MGHLAQYPLAIGRRSVASSYSTRPGSGCRTQSPKVRTLDDRAAEIEAVMDTVGFGQAVVSGLSDAEQPPSCSRQHDQSERGH